MRAFRVDKEGREDINACLQWCEVLKKHNQHYSLLFQGVQNAI